MTEFNLEVVAAESFLWPQYGPNNEVPEPSETDNADYCISLPHAYAAARGIEPETQLFVKPGMGTYVNVKPVDSNEKLCLSCEPAPPEELARLIAVAKARPIQAVLDAIETAREFAELP